MARSAEAERVQGRGTPYVAVQIALLLAIAVAPRQVADLPAIPADLADLSALAGLLIGAAGGLLVLIAALFLGRNLTIFPAPKADAALTQRGIYAIVRHPMYGGVILCALGWSLLRASLPGLLLSLGLICFFDRKAHFEERRLMAKFPEYADYRRRVRKLIPWVY